jgi:hypothetical protein
MVDEGDFAHHRPTMHMDQSDRLAIVFTLVAVASAPYAWPRSRLRKGLAPAA